VIAVGLYEIAAAVHVLAVVLAFGPTFAYPFMQVAAEKREPASIPYFWRVQMRIDRVFVIPGAVVVLLAGVYLVATGPWTLAEPWVGSGLLIVGLLLVGVLAVLGPGERRAAELAERDLGTGGELSDEYWAVSRRVAMAGGFASLLVVIAIVLMVLKPG
jgi:uncharacterized membrane protein